MCIDDEISFEIPESWVWVRLEDISFVGTGSTPDRTNKEYYTGSIPWVNSSLTQNDYILQTPEFISEKAIEETSCRIYPIGTLIVAMYGQGKTRGQVSELKIAAATNQACAAIQVYNCDIKTFVKLFFKYNYTTIRRKASGGAQPNLNLLKIKKIVLPLPPLAEQKRIVAKIEELMPILHKYDKAQKVLDELNGAMPVRLRQSILQEAIQGKLIPQDPNDEPASVLLDKIRAEKVRLVKEGKLKKKDIIDSIIFKGDDNKYYEQVDGKALQIETDYSFPDTWEVVRLAHICRLMDGEKKDGNYICLDAKYLRGKSSGDIQPKGKFVSTGDNIILVDGENSGEVFSVPHDGYMGSTFKQLWVSGNMHLPYVLYFIQFYKDLLRNSKKGAAIPHLNKEIFYSLVVGIPPYQEQERIANAIGELYARL